MKLTLALNTFLVFILGVFGTPYGSLRNDSVPEIDSSSILRGTPHQGAHNYTAPVVVNETAGSHCQPGHPHWRPSVNDSGPGPVAVPHSLGSNIALSTGALAVGVAAAMTLL
ncbi:hypothetical protein GGR51DRAFT_563420 [Nemania sp. FL0031]|nr:hypothetical protein GGR51DRAFT_563420 [Nemania sp. FL0031]